MKVWPRSHYNSFQLFGHSHGKLKEEGKQLDISVENINYTPISLDEVIDVMKNKPDNFNLVRR
jgi:calcineurin-like phosphoesterase family protein